MTGQTPTVKMELVSAGIRPQEPDRQPQKSPKCLFFQEGGVCKMPSGQVTLLREEMVSKVQNLLLSAGKVARRIQEN